MAHEKEKAQYEEDCNNYVQAWELWENRQDGRNWTPCMCQPAWSQWCEYRRKKKPSFQPQYFSGLNWWEAHGRGLVGKVVEFSDDPESGWKKGVLSSVRDQARHFIRESGYPFEYIRTTPQTHTHPTITIGGVELPRPETDALVQLTHYWIWQLDDIKSSVWKNDKTDHRRLRHGIVHLTKDRAQAWADWWVDTVIKAVNK